MTGRYFKTNTMKVYIAGKITGTSLQLTKDIFLKIEETFRLYGIVPVNPFKLGIPDHWTFEQAKPYCFKAIRNCAGIFMLHDYEDSPGSLEELAYAKKLNLNIYYASALDIFQAIEDAKSYPFKPDYSKRAKPGLNSPLNQYHL